jgi:hypothetical protein
MGGGHVARIQGRGNAYVVLARKPKGKRLTGPRRRWENNNEMCLKG